MPALERVAKRGCGVDCLGARVELLSVCSLFRRGWLFSGNWLVFVFWRMATGHTLAPASLIAPWTLEQTVKLVAATAVLAVLLSVRRWIKWAFAMPVALVAMSLMGAALLIQAGLSGPTHGFYLPSLGA